MTISERIYLRLPTLHNLKDAFRSLRLGVPAKREKFYYGVLSSSVCAIAVDEDNLAQGLLSLDARTAEYVIRFDASLTRVGILLGIPVERRSDQGPQ